MKKALFFILVICCILVASGCSSYPSDEWQTIYLAKCGSLKIPKEWRMFEKDGRVYIVDADNHPIMIQTHSYCGVDDGDEGETESNAYFDNVTNIRYLTSGVLSNGAVYGEVLVRHENKQSAKHYLSIGHLTTIDLVVWDESVSRNMLLTIAETFAAESE